jgi:hypothetical protein
VKQALEEVSEAEMSEALGAGKSERSEGRLGTGPDITDEGLSPGGEAGVAGAAGSSGVVSSGGIACISRAGRRWCMRHDSIGAQVKAITGE